MLISIKSEEEREKILEACQGSFLNLPAENTVKHAHLPMVVEYDEEVIDSIVGQYNLNEVNSTDNFIEWFTVC